MVDELALYNPDPSTYRWKRKYDGFVEFIEFQRRGLFGFWFSVHPRIEVNVMHIELYGIEGAISRTNQLAEEHVERLKAGPINPLDQISGYE